MQKPSSLACSFALSLPLFAPQFGLFRAAHIVQRMHVYAHRYESQVDLSTSAAAYSYTKQRGVITRIRRAALLKPLGQRRLILAEPVAHTCAWQEPGCVPSMLNTPELGDSLRRNDSARKSEKLRNGKQFNRNCTWKLDGCHGAVFLPLLLMAFGPLLTASR